MTLEENAGAVILCDRGTIDCLAYWDDEPARFWADLGTTHATELARYAAVIHLRSPSVDNGYDHSSPIRVESAEEAAVLDRRILAAWSPHPVRTIVDSTTSFLDKLDAAITAIHHHTPACCDPVPAARI